MSYLWPSFSTMLSRRKQLLAVVVSAFLAMLNRPLALSVEECGAECTAYKRIVCVVAATNCSNTNNDTQRDECISNFVPCYGDLERPVNDTCWSQFLCCNRFRNNNDGETVQTCLRFADLCTGLSDNVKAFDRCVWRVRCNRSQPIRRENTPPMQNLCFTRRQQNCSCINKRFFNAEITCDLTSSCCLPREEYPPSTCGQFSRFYPVLDTQPDLSDHLNSDRRHLPETHSDSDSESMIADEGVIDEDYDDENDDTGMRWLGRQWCYRRCPSYCRVRRRKVWRRRRVRRTTTTPTMTTTTEMMTTTTPLTTLAPEVRTKGPRDPNCSDFNNFEDVLYWEETYPADNCNYYPFYKHEFLQAIYLNFTYIMDLAPVGTT